VTKRPGGARPCTGCRKSVRSLSGMCQQCLHPETRPSRPCAYCGTTTRSEDRLCLVCGPHDATLGEEPRDADGLPEGAWVLDPVRRIAVWREAVSA
jgi:recombinational DNA repair protein RecR